MLYFFAILSALLGLYRKCPKCEKIQQFKDKKKGDNVTCKRCGHKFTLK